jgi:hypothetical protein
MASPPVPGDQDFLKVGGLWDLSGGEATRQIPISSIFPARWVGVKVSAWHCMLLPIWMI